MSEQATELLANNREGLRTYEVERAAEIEAMRTRPVSEPGPSISCIGDLAARIGADATAPIKQERSSLRDWLVAQEEPPEVSFGPPLHKRRGSRCKQSKLASILYIFSTIKVASFDCGVSGWKREEENTRASSQMLELAGVLAEE
jgi:hypothetical protein